MQQMAALIVDHMLFLAVCPEDQVELRTSVKLLEYFVWLIEEQFTDAERTAIRDAAQQMLDSAAAPHDEYGYRAALTEQEQRFLTNIAAGRFSQRDED